MLCVFCLIVLWGFSLGTSYSGVKGTQKRRFRPASISPTFPDIVPRYGEK